MGLILTAQLIILDLLGRYSLRCWTAASAAVVCIQHSYWQQGFASSLISHGVPLSTVHNISACQRCGFSDCRRTGSLCAVLVLQKTNEYCCSYDFKKEGTYILSLGNLVWTKFAKTQVFKKTDLQVPWGLQKCFLSLKSHYQSFSCNIF